MKNQSAQTLILVLLIMAVSLTVGLGVASRAVSTLRQSSSTAQSTAAYHAAEAGVENYLQELTTNPTFEQGDSTYCDDAGNWLDLPGSDSSYCCSVEQVNDEFKAHVRQDNVVQVDLSGTELSGQNVNIEWHTGQDTAEAAITYILVEDKTGGDYYHVKDSYDPVGSRSSINNFSTPISSSGDYGNRAVVATESGGGDRDRILRIRPLYADTHLRVYATGKQLPEQQTEIICQGRTGEIVRKVHVIRGEPALPAVFDFALFSASQATPLQK